ncbi:MAG: hypothetical protein VXZ96_16270 [Myxococcota bacterium]|nr:hypothetical protein [Myxococcota bacterium]
MMWMICTSVVQWTMMAQASEPVIIRLGGETVSADAPPPTTAQTPIQTMNMSLQDADIHHAIRLISDVANLNFVIADGVSGTVTVELTEVPWTDALNAILMSKGLMAVPIGDIVFVQAISP